MTQPLFLALLLMLQGPETKAIQPFGSRPPVASSLSRGPNLKCGAEALYFSLKWLDLSVPDYKAVETKLGAPSGLGYSMADLDATARHFGAMTLGVETTLENLALRKETLAQIAHLKSGHYVNIVGQGGGMIDIVNPPAREERIPRETFNALWDHKVLLLSTAPIVKEEDLPRPFPWKLVAALGFGVILTAIIILILKRRKHAGA